MVSATTRWCMVSYFIGLLLGLVILILSFMRTKKVETKLLIFNSVNTLVALMIVVLSDIIDSPSIVDVAWIYIATGFVFTVALLKFFGLKRHYDDAL